MVDNETEEKLEWGRSLSKKQVFIIKLGHSKSHRTASYTYRVGRWFTGTFGMSSEQYGDW